MRGHWPTRGGACASWTGLGFAILQGPETQLARVHSRLLVALASVSVPLSTDTIQVLASEVHS